MQCAIIHMGKHGPQLPGTPVHMYSQSPFLISKQHQQTEACIRELSCMCTEVNRGLYVTWTEVGIWLGMKVPLHKSDQVLAQAVIWHTHPLQPLSNHCPGRVQLSLSHASNDKRTCRCICLTLNCTHRQGGSIQSRCQHWQYPEANLHFLYFWLIWECFLCAAGTAG